MAAINSMYQYSLAAYLDVFNHSLRHSLPDSHLPKRLRNIIDTLTINVYNYACTGERPLHSLVSHDTLLSLSLLGLFERHKLLFSFQMTIKIQEVESSLDREELDFFIKGSISLEKSSRRKPYDWIPEQGWEDIIKLMTINSEVFGSLADDIEKNEKVWKEVSMSTYAYITLLSLSL